MKELIYGAARAAARRLGLASRARAERLASVGQRRQERVAELKRALEEARAETRMWRARFQEASRSAPRSDNDTVTRDGTLQELCRVREREEQHRRSIAELQEKAQSSERALRIAREQLTAVEAKLETVDKAIAALDRRTRDASGASHADQDKAAAPR